jgi:hypothetical protein
MRTGRSVVLCAALGGVLGGCAVLGYDPPPRAISQPPNQIALQKSLTLVAKTVNWSGIEASPARPAHAISPADWIVCAQSGARDLAGPYALFFNGDTMVHFRIAVLIDECARVPYAPVPLVLEEPAPPPGPLAKRP